MKYLLTLTVCFLFSLTSFSQEKSNTNTQQTITVVTTVESSSNELLSKDEVKTIFSKSTLHNSTTASKCRVIEKKFNKIRGYKHRSLRA